MRFAPMSADTIEVVNNLVESVRDLPVSIASYQLSGLYAAMLPDKFRSTRGVFFTPPALVERLLDMAEAAGIDWTRHRVIDPAAGGGAFVAPIAARMARRLRASGLDSQATLAIIESRLRGIEIDPFSAWMSHMFLEASLLDECRIAERRVRPLIFTRDALTVPDSWLGGAHLVIGNPPYGRITLTPETRLRYQRSIRGHANLYGLFADLAVRLARPGGVVALVTPASFLAGEYFKNLRQLIAEAAPPCAIDFVSDRANVFSGVLQETVLVTLRRDGERCGVNVNFALPTSGTKKCSITPVGVFDLPRDPQAPWLLPRVSQNVALARAAARTRYRFRDYGVEVNTGPFVWNRYKHLLRPESEPGTHPIVWAESVSFGRKFQLNAIRRDHKPYLLVPPTGRHLITHESCVLLQRTTAKEQARRLIASVLPENIIAEARGVVVENHLNMLRITQRSLDDSATLTLDVLAALLNSDVMDRLFRCISGSVAVSAYELESLPLPHPDAMAALAELLRYGAMDTESIDLMLEEAYGSVLAEAVVA